jgi:hypothetical protein
MPIPAITLLGRVAAPLLPQLYLFASQKAVPAISHILADPGGYASRIGDLIVWNNSGGRTVLAGLQSLGENQARIQQAVTSIETAQIATNAALGSLHTLSLATLGITSLTGGFMLWRLQAINDRLNELVTVIKDIEDNITAQNKAHLMTAVQKLQEYDNTKQNRLLEIASGEAQHAANIYGHLARTEADKRNPRLPVLNYRSRCYLLALAVEFRSRLLLEELSQTTVRYDGELENIRAVSSATFKAGIGNEPHEFLSYSMHNAGVSLDLMTEIYQHAQRLGVFSSDKEHKQIQSPSDMFEFCRERGITGKRMRLPFSNTSSYATRIKYTMACFEDIGRVEALSLIAKHAKETNLSVRDIQKQMEKSGAEARKSNPEDAILAYSLI